MKILIMVGQLIAGLSILVTLHELGHYLAARAFGMRVEKFYLFFDAWGKKLFSFKKGDTEYGVGWLPLGGYVKISGMIDESMDKEAMAKPPEPWEFRSKPAWQRFIVMIAGVVVNAVLAVIIFSMTTFYYGETYLPNAQVKHGIVAKSYAQELGFQTGDKIISINGQTIERFDEVISPEILLSDHVEYQVLRGDEEVTITLPEDFLETYTDNRDEFIEERMTFFVDEVTPGSNAAKGGLEAGDIITKVNTTDIQFFDQFREALLDLTGQEANFTVTRDGQTTELKLLVDEEGKVGFRPQTNDFEFEQLQFGFFESFPKGYTKASNILTDNIKGLGKVVTGKVSASKSVQGPVRLATFYGSQWIWSKFWYITGLLSIVLAFMNILPIPALDGGHALFLGIEMLRGKPLSDKFMERAQMVGMILLLSLMAFALTNDIWQIAK